MSPILIQPFATMTAAQKTAAKPAASENSGDSSSEVEELQAQTQEEKGKGEPPDQKKEALEKKNDE